jgi:hypothetical protein
VADEKPAVEGKADAKPEGWQRSARERAERRIYASPAGLEDLIDRLTNTRMVRAQDGSIVPGGQIPNREMQERAILLALKVADPVHGKASARVKELEAGLYEVQCSLDETGALLETLKQKKAALPKAPEVNP